MLSEKDSERYRKLFSKLDRNSDGKIDVNDLVIFFDKHNYEKVNETSLSRAQVNDLLNSILFIKVILLIIYFQIVYSLRSLFLKVARKKMETLIFQSLFII